MYYLFMVDHGVERFCGAGHLCVMPVFKVSYYWHVVQVSL